MSNPILRIKSRQNSVFEVTVDTRNIVVGAAGSEGDPLTFRLPLRFPTASLHQFIIRVDDGRPDVVFDRTEAGAVIHFATAGIHKITLIGKSGAFMDAAYDRNKWIYLSKWGKEFKGFAPNAFQSMVNLMIGFKEPIKISGNRNNFFNGIKGFTPDFDMTKVDVSGVTSFTGFFSGIQLPLPGALNPFINAANSLSLLYAGANMSTVAKVEVVSSTASDFSNFLENSSFQGQLILNAPVYNMYEMLKGVLNPPSLGKVDVRRVTDSRWISFITAPMSVANTDSTLIGWAGLNWAEVMSPGARAVNFRGSKHSDNPTVLSAKSFLQSKGFTFTNLTMA